MRRTAIVSGAAKGIGRCITEKLIADGFFVFAVDTDMEAGAEMEQGLGPRNVRFVAGDVSLESDVISLFEKAAARTGSVDVLVNNAGIIRDNLIWNMSADEFDRVISVNLKGTWLMCREAAKRMREQRSGAIVNIASRAWLGNRGQGNYSASKAGVVALTRVLALELGRYNVSVNAVAPGLIDTLLTRGLDKAVLEKLIEAQPTRTMGRPEDVAETVAFLVSGKNQFITGQTIYVDGGKSVGAGI